MIHPVTLIYLNLDAREKTRDKSDGVERYSLETVQPRPYGLFYAHSVEDDKYVAHMACQVIPSLNLQITRFTWRTDDHPYGDYNYYIDIIGEVQQSKSGQGEWTLRDLYLDVLVYEGKKVKIIDTDDYLQAVEAGHFRPGERELTLERTHWLVNQLGEHGYSLERFLAQHDIHLEWN